MSSETGHNSVSVSMPETKRPELSFQASPVQEGVATDYTYEPLQSSRHIRIVQLRPSGDATAPLQCSFHQAALDDLEDKYEALSYTWGDPIFPCTVEIHPTRKVLSITANLHSALLRFRDAYHPRHLWIDALCINQADLQEKSNQIPLMFNIFKSAKRVLVWLGSGREEQKAITLLTTLSRIDGFTVPVSPSDIQYTVNEDSVGSRVDLRPFSQAVSKALFAFFSAPYFGRVWIIQELVANIDVALYCGTTEITWARFEAAFQILQRAPFRRDYLSPARSAAFRTFFSFRNNYRSSIFKLLHVFSHSLSTDPRDRLYALFNLSNDLRQPTDAVASNSKIPLQIDYSKPADGIWTEFALSAIEAGHFREVIGAVLRRSSTINCLSRMPSWAPRWYDPPTSTQFLSPKLVGDFVGVSHDTKMILLVIETACVTGQSLYPEPELIRVAEIYNWDSLGITPSNVSHELLSTLLFIFLGNKENIPSEPEGCDRPPWNFQPNVLSSFGFSDDDCARFDTILTKLARGDAQTSNTCTSQNTNEFSSRWDTFAGQWYPFRTRSYEEEANKFCAVSVTFVGIANVLPRPNDAIWHLPITKAPPYYWKEKFRPVPTYNGVLLRPRPEGPSTDGMKGPYAIAGFVHLFPLFKHHERCKLSEDDPCEEDCSHAADDCTCGYGTPIVLPDSHSQDPKSLGHLAEICNIHWKEVTVDLV